jgi:hypothetical protein
MYKPIVECRINKYTSINILRDEFLLSSGLIIFISSLSVYAYYLIMHIEITPGMSTLTYLHYCEIRFNMM